MDNSKPLGNRLDQLPESDVYLTSIYGINKGLKSFFPDRDVPVVPTTGTTHLRALMRKNRKISFPFFTTNIATTEENVTGYNAFSLRKQGITSARLGSTGSKQTMNYRFHLSPASVVINVMFLTNDVKDIYAFTPRWLAASNGHYLNFSITAAQEDGDEKDLAPIDINVTLDKTIQFPDMEIEEMDAFYTLQTSLSMATYHGVVSKKLSIISTRVNIDTIVSAANVNAATLIFPLIPN
jgi:hypothetical protein